MTRRVAKTKGTEGASTRALEIALLGLCLCVLALRVTYTEAPTAQTLTVPGSLGDTVYSLSLSGLLIFALVFWLLWGLCTNRLKYQFTGMEIGLALFCFAAALSTLGASDKRSAITHIMTLLGPVIAALLLAQILDSHSRIRVVLIVVAALGIVSAYQCAEQFLVSNQITIEQYEKAPETLLTPLGITPGTFQHFLFEHRLYSRGIRGFFTTSNSAASFAIMASFAAVVLLIQRWRHRKDDEPGLRYRLFPALAVLVVITGLALTQSKGGILGFVVAGVLFALLWWVRRRFSAHKKPAVAVLAFVALLLVAGAAYTGVSYGLKHGRLPGGNSMLVRWQYWVASARMCADHPLAGVGPGNFAYYYPHYKPAPALESVADPHNFLLSLLTQYGPLGLLGFLAMVLAPVCRSAASTVKDPFSESPSQLPFKKLAILMLFVTCACLLLFRPMLLPTTAAGSIDILLYEVVTLYITPVAAFLIGSLLLAAPLEGKGKGKGLSRFNRAVLIAALTGAILGVLIHNLIDFAIFEPGIWTAFWIVMACAAAIIRQQREDSSVARRASPLLKLTAVAVTLVLLGTYGRYVWKPVYDMTVKIQQAQRATSMGRFDDAHRLLDAASEASSLSPTPLNLNGRLYLQRYEQTGQRQSSLLEKAAQCFQRAVRVNPADYKNYEKLAMVYGELEQPRKAYDWYIKATELYPGCGRLWFGLAQMAERLGRTDAALADYRKAAEIEDSYRRQFRQMYPERETVISRLGEENYRLAKKRIEALSK